MTQEGTLHYVKLSFLVALKEVYWNSEDDFLRNHCLFTFWCLTQYIPVYSKILQDKTEIVKKMKKIRVFLDKLQYIIFNSAYNLVCYFYHAKHHR